MTRNCSSSEVIQAKLSWFLVHSNGRNIQEFFFLLCITIKLRGMKSLPISKYRFNHLTTLVSNSWIDKLAKYFWIAEYTSYKHINETYQISNLTSHNRLIWSGINYSADGRRLTADGWRLTKHSDTINSNAKIFLDRIITSEDLRANLVECVDTLLRNPLPYG